ncbi:MAG: hypothetical protein K0Q43_1646 [Ramlibacter sp.]|jgi:hypothetical protein|nr:hypothetical protein [Ramlibacter sp.]
MSRDNYFLARIAATQLQVDRELGRLARLCRVELPRPGVAERVLRRDASVCGTANALAFAKLQGVLALHYVLQAKFATELAGGAVLPNRDRTATLR